MCYRFKGRFIISFTVHLEFTAELFRCSETRHLKKMPMVTDGPGLDVLQKSFTRDQFSLNTSQGPAIQYYGNVFIFLMENANLHKILFYIKI